MSTVAHQRVHIWVVFRLSTDSPQPVKKFPTVTSMFDVTIKGLAPRLRHFVPFARECVSMATLVCTHGTAILTNCESFELVEERIFYAFQVRTRTIINLSLWKIFFIVYSIIIWHCTNYCYSNSLVGERVLMIDYRAMIVIKLTSSSLLWETHSIEGEGRRGTLLYIVVKLVNFYFCPRSSVVVNTKQQE